MTAFELFGQLFTETSIFGAGMVIGFISLLLGYAKATSKEWSPSAIIFATLTWTISLFILQDTVMSASLFVIGSIAFVLGLIPLFTTGHNQQQLDIFKLIIINLLILLIFNFGVFSYSNEIISMSDNSFTTSVLTLNDNIDLFLDNYQPNEQTCNPANPNCTDDLITGGEDSSNFDAISSIFNIGKTVISFVKLLPLSLILTTQIPFIIKNFIPNPLLQFLITLFSGLWLLVNTYFVYKFVTDSRGVKK